ncbi:MAG: DUF2723 domain-containing protein [Chloroflexi bacterium]|nr:DUF2723 domain-containing protein [Chloroflexota bacterium]
MWQRIRQTAVWLLPTLALGLYTGRVISEQWAWAYGAGAGAALILTLVTLLLAGGIIKPHGLRATWPLLLLFFYVFYPEPDPVTAVLVGALSFFTLMLAGYNDSPVFKTTVLTEQEKLWIGGLGTAVFFGTLYIFTLAPDILPADNGEFQLIATQLGIAHPPGFPLYTLLAHLFTRLPGPASPAYMVNLFSAITSAATLVLLYLTVCQLARRHLAAVTAVITLGTATTFWAQATTANIRSLTTFFAALAIYALVRLYGDWRLGNWRLGDWRLGDWRLGDWRLGGKWLLLLATALGLGVTHHLSLAFMGVVFVLFLLWLDWRFFVTPRRWVRPLLILLLVLLPLLYLPLRAFADVRGAKESLATLPGFLNHFLGLGFQGDFFYYLQPIVLIERFKIMGSVLTFQFAPWLLLGMLIGFLLLLKQEWRLALTLGAAFALHTFVTAAYRAPQTVEYMLPAYLPLVIFLGYAMGKLDKIAPQLAERFGKSFQRDLPNCAARLSRALARLFIASLVAAALYQGWQHFPSYAYLNHSTDTRDYTQFLLQEAPPDSLLLANWHWVTPLWYLQDVEGQRPDVTIKYVAPGSEPYSQTWAQAIAAGLADGRPVIATNFDAAAYQTLPPAEPLGEAFLFRQQPRTAVPANFTPFDDTLDNARFLAYHLQPTDGAAGEEVILTLAWKPITRLNAEGEITQAPVSLYAHLIDSDGRLYAQADLTVRPQPEGITLTQFRLTPRPGALPSAYTLLIGSEDVRIPLSTFTITAAAWPPATQNRLYRPAADDPARRLIGYDWDNTLPDQPRLYLHWQTADGYVTEVRDNNFDDLPALRGPWGVVGNRYSVVGDRSEGHYVPLGQGLVWTGQSISNFQSFGFAQDKPPISKGDMLSLPQTLTAGRPVLRDLVTAVRLIGFEKDGYHWAWCDSYDSVPAMGAVPTLKWIAGSRVSSPILITYPDEAFPDYTEYCISEKPAPGAPVLFVDKTAVPGQTIGATLQLYDAFTGRPLPILDERITAQYQWIPLGFTRIGE